VKKQWAKLYCSDKHGQILVRRVRGQGHPTVTVVVDLDHHTLGEAELSLEFSGEDAERKADEAFDGMTEGRAAKLVEKGILAALEGDL